MKIIKALVTAGGALKDGGSEAPELEGEILLRHVLNISRAELYSSLESIIDVNDYNLFLSYIERRLNKEPVAYITGHKEFYNVNIYVNRNVLIPRPETELLVEETLMLLNNVDYPLVCDVGTGSGAISIALAANHPSLKVYALDASPVCLEIAAKNIAAHRLEKRVNLLTSDLLCNLPEPVNIIVANLPYVKKSEVRNIMYEPAFALDGGIDGLNVIRNLLFQFKPYLKNTGSLLLEIGYGQKSRVAHAVKQVCPDSQLEFKNDLAGIPRLAVIKPS